MRRAIALGAPVAAVYRTASWSAARGFGLRDRGLVAPGYLADILLLDDLASCAVHLVLRRGRPVTEQTFDDRVLPPPPAGNSVRLGAVTARTFAAPAPGPSTPVIGIIPGKILTERLQADLPFRGGERHADPTRDLLKVCVLERHGRNGNVGRGFVKGFGLERGALASSVGHDSHNICVLGASDEDMALAVNRVHRAGRRLCRGPRRAGDSRTRLADCRPDERLVGRSGPPCGRHPEGRGSRDGLPAFRPLAAALVSAAAGHPASKDHRPWAGRCRSL